MILIAMVFIILKIFFQVCCVYICMVVTCVDAVFAEKDS